MDSFKVGDLVWAKMKGFPHWPGIIVNPPKDVKMGKKPPGSYCIYFFGTKNYGWIEEAKLKPYITYKEEFMKAKNSKNLKEALLEIEEFSEKGNMSLLNIFETSESVVDNISETGEHSASTSKSPKPKSSKSVSFDDSFIKYSKSVKTNQESPSGSGVKRKKILKNVENGSSGFGFNAKRRMPTKRHSDPVLLHGYNRKGMLKFPDADTTTPESNRKWVEGSSNLEKSNSGNTDMDTVSVNDKSIDEEKRIEPGEYKVGFIGLGIIGSSIVKNLIKSGHKIVLWNRTTDKCKEFSSEGVDVARNPEELANMSDIICCCVSDPNAAKEIVFGSNGILAEMNNKSLIQMTGLDPEASLDIAEAVASNGGRYLEAPIHGSKKEAEEGSLIVLTAGDRSLFEDCSSLFESYAKRAVFLGDLGNALKMYIVLQLISGVTLSGLAEGMALAERTGVQLSDLLEVLHMSVVNCPLINEKCQAIKNCDYTAKQALAHQQKDLRLALLLADSIEQPVPLAAASNELFKHAKRLGYGDHDAAAVFVRSRF